MRRVPRSSPRSIRVLERNSYATEALREACRPAEYYRTMRSKGPSGSAATSSRHTPPDQVSAFRSGWHTAVGIAFLVLGLLVVVVDDVIRGVKVTLLPGGHSELHLLLGVAIAAYALEVVRS